MKKLLIIVGLLLIVTPVMGATPTVVPPTPTPSVTPSVTPTTTPRTTPTPVPADVPSGVIEWPYAINLRANFTDFSTGALTDQKFVNIKNGAEFSVPAGQRFYVQSINWSCLSAVTAYLEFDGITSDQKFDMVYFPFTGQGKILTFINPVTSLDPACAPVITTDRGCTGWCFIGGELK